MDSPDSTTALPSSSSSSSSALPSSSSSSATKPGGGGSGGDASTRVNEGLKNLLESNKEAPPSDRPSSPEPNCVICLERVQNKSFADSCFHQFCYVCILEWSKVKAECPLCKQSFKSIIHSVVSMDNYEQYYVPTPPPADPSDSPDDDFMRSLRLYDWGILPSAAAGGADDALPTTAFAQRLRAFRQRSFLTFHNYYQPGSSAPSSSSSSRSTSNDIWTNFGSHFDFRSRFGLNNLDHRSSTTSQNRLNSAYNTAVRRVMDPEGNDAWHVCQRNCPVHRPSNQRDEDSREDEEDRGRSSQQYRRRREASSREFRLYVYTRGLYAKAPPSNSRTRSTDPNFYACNPACVHRLVPWLNRELGVLLHDREETVSKVLKEILSLIKQVPIRSRDFYNAMRPHFVGRTIHFIHELDNFASSPHENLSTWDREVQHERRRPRVEERNLPAGDEIEDIDSSDSDDDVDVDGADGFPWRSVTPNSDEDLERLARDQRGRTDNADAADAAAERRDRRGGNARSEGDDRPGRSRRRHGIDDGSDRRRAEREGEERQRGEAVTPPRITGRERTPGGDDRREMNDSASRHRHHRPSTPYRQPGRGNTSTNTSPISPSNDQDGPSSSETTTLRRYDAAISSLSQSGWESPPLETPSVRNATQLSPSLSSSRLESNKPKTSADTSPSLSDVEVVGFVKAMAERTPVEVTLSSDEEDSGNRDPDIILERRKKRLSKGGATEKTSRKDKIRSRRKRRRDPRPSTLAGEGSSGNNNNDSSGSVVVDVEEENDARSASKSSATTSSNAAAAVAGRADASRKEENNSDQEWYDALSALSPARDDDDTEITEVLRKSGTIQNTEVVIGDSDDEKDSDDDDDVIIESEGPRSWSSYADQRRPKRHRRRNEDNNPSQFSTNEDEDDEENSSSSSSTQASAAATASSVLRAKVWDFLESARNERESADRAKGRKENRGWDAEEEEGEEEEEKADGRKRRRSTSSSTTRPGNRSKSPQKRKNSGTTSSKGKGKGKGKSSTRKTDVADEAGGERATESGGTLPEARNGGRSGAAAASAIPNAVVEEEECLQSEPPTRGSAPTDNPEESLGSLPSHQDSAETESLEGSLRSVASTQDSAQISENLASSSSVEETHSMGEEANRTPASPPAKKKIVKIKSVVAKANLSPSGGSSMDLADETDEELNGASSDVEDRKERKPDLRSVIEKLSRNDCDAANERKRHRSADAKEKKSKKEKRKREKEESRERRRDESKKRLKS